MTDNTIEEFKKSVCEIEKVSKDFVMFCFAFHSLLMRLKEGDVVKDWFVTYSNFDDIHIYVIFTSGKQIDQTFIYDKELYNGSSE